MLAMPTASDGAPPVRREQGALAHVLREVLHLLDGDRETPARDGVHGRIGGRRAHDARAGC